MRLGLGGQGLHRSARQEEDHLAAGGRIAVVEARHKRVGEDGCREEMVVAAGGNRRVEEGDIVDDRSLGVEEAAHRGADHSHPGEGSCWEVGGQAAADSHPDEGGIAGSHSLEVAGVLEEAVRTGADSRPGEGKVVGHILVEVVLL